MKNYTRKFLALFRNQGLAILYMIAIALTFTLVWAKSEGSKAPQIREVEFITGRWENYADGYSGIKFSHPPDWEVSRRGSEQSLTLKSPDKKTILSLCVSKNNTTSPSCLSGNFSARQTVKSGTIKIFGLDVERDKVPSLTNDRVVEYYYPKVPLKIENDWYFSAYFSADLNKVAEVNISLEDNDDRVIAEKILSSLKKL